MQTAYILNLFPVFVMFFDVFSTGGHSLRPGANPHVFY